MAQTGLGILLKSLRDGRGLSLRETGQLSEVDHAYIHRLETGDKDSPSPDVLNKLLKVLKPGERELEMAKWLSGHDANPELVSYTLSDPSFTAEMFTTAAGMRHRGNARPDVETVVTRVKKLFLDEI